MFNVQRLVDMNTKRKGRINREGKEKVNMVLYYESNIYIEQLTWKLNPPSDSLCSLDRIWTDKSAGQVFRMSIKRGGWLLSELLDTQHFSVTIRM